MIEEIININVINYSDYTVHIVDDSRSITAMLTNLLEEEGYNVTSTSNGKDAINYIYKNKPNLIILDVEMPVMDGYETIEQLKKYKQTSNIPVIFHTALTKPDVIGYLFEIGASDYISKPFIPEELLARIEKEIKNINLQNILKDKMSKLAEALSTDPLTKTYNKMHMTSIINSSLKKLEIDGKGSFSLIYIDIDQFNSFTKIHGMKESENAIKKISIVLKQSIRDKDVLSRWSGDMFMILCPQIAKDNLDDMAKYIKNNIGEITFKSDMHLTCTISMINSSTATSKQELLTKLETRMSDLTAVSKNSIVSTDGKVIR
ncbi:response regulator [Candidatus Sulfurimonas marisnigri]|uniref:Response regulator n=1 Tax=Candidatus Sulfurimonas marisnigri TaxID=2740405 RepID=A0A7S7M259_9BACT|nr:response regulator [Candidatus Sulfurimonas marisnigri]QOY55143.1 response regulator [Candidatus Sulfurimonas marisnigri]